MVCARTNSDSARLSNRSSLTRSRVAGPGIGILETRMRLPPEIRTDRLVLRPWREQDAVALCPILETSFEHLGPWIPARVATPAPVPELEQRLAGFARDFAEDKAWRYALLTGDD